MKGFGVLFLAFVGLTSADYAWLLEEPDLPDALRQSLVTPPSENATQCSFTTFQYCQVWLFQSFEAVV